MEVGAGDETVRRRAAIGVKIGTLANHEWAMGAVIDGFERRSAHVDLVRIERGVDLRRREEMRRQPRLYAACDLLALEVSDDRKQLQSFDRLPAVHAFLVDETSAKHLKPAADTEHRRLVGAVLTNRDVEPALAEPGEISHRGLRTRHDDEIRDSESGGIADPSHANAWFGRQRLKLVEIGDAWQPHDRDVDERLLIRLPGSSVPVHGVFGR